MSRRSESAYMPINAEKFERAVMRKGYNLNTLAASFGRAAGYFTKAMGTGEMAFTTAYAVKGLLGIPLEEYAGKEEPEEKPTGAWSEERMEAFIKKMVKEAFEEL